MSVPGVKINVVELLWSLSTDALTNVLVEACRPRPEVTHRLLNAWLSEDSEERVASLGSVGSPGRAAARDMLATFSVGTVPAVHDPTDNLVADASASNQKLLDAAKLGDMDVVTRLVGGGAKAVCTEDGLSPAMFAVMRGRPSGILDCLLSSGVDVHQRSPTDLTLLHLWSVQLLLSEEDKLEAERKLKLLVHYQADVDARVGLSGDTPLHFVAREFQRHLERAKRPGATISAHLNVLGARFMYRLLLRAGADPERWDVRGRTPRDLAGEALAPADEPVPADLVASDLGSEVSDPLSGVTTTEACMSSQTVNNSSPGGFVCKFGKARRGGVRVSTWTSTTISERERETGRTGKGRRRRWKGERTAEREEVKHSEENRSGNQKSKEHLRWQVQRFKTKLGDCDWIIVLLVMRLAVSQQTLSPHSREGKDRRTCETRRKTTKTRLPSQYQYQKVSRPSLNLFADTPEADKEHSSVLQVASKIVRTTLVTILGLTPPTDEGTRHERSSVIKACACSEKVICSRPLMTLHTAQYCPV